jgi:glycosyltransferase involved in cell wall biosynthesis
MRLIAQVNGAKPFSYGWLNGHLEAFTIPRSAGVVCITRYTEDAVRALARRTWLLPNAVDGTFYDIVSVPEKPPVAICVGHVCHRKNQNRFIRALDALAVERRFRMVFLGHAPDDPYVAEFRELLRTRPWCEHVGFADRAALRQWFARASLLALPSLEDNCPMAVLEAMAAGVPVVAAKVGGVPDLVEDRVTGLICDPLDDASMRRAVAELLANRPLATGLAETARRCALDRFHPRIIAQRHIEIYREVLSSETSGA